MLRLKCDQCEQRIPNGTALIRSRSLVQVAFHRECYCPTPPSIPEQRRPVHDETSGVRLRMSAVDLRM